MNTIHKKALVEDNVQLGKKNTIGPHVIIEDGVTIGSHNTIGPGVVIFNGTTIGDGNEIHAGAVIGDTPQDIAFQNKESFVTIGNNNKIREYVTIHRGTKEGSATTIGNDNFFMGYTHIAHNCQIGSGVVTVNTVVLGGYVILEHYSFISASVVIHQFCRIGTYAIVSGLSAVNQDIPPFVMCGGRPAVVNGINTVGLKRAGMKPPIRAEIKQAFKILYRSGLNTENALGKIENECASEEVGQFAIFIKNSSRGVASFGETRF
ncbi:MAG: acyl-ACP--UDP-N-acetylglucosamine O-acyltransferase [Candidatus Omnitrophica bacterium]|nr:acyl-ACP--UDP-N-acetylglucosamine O-acyltransferase [Candidatus Omnitrophota bacterium]